MAICDSISLMLLTQSATFTVGTADATLTYPYFI